MTQQPEEPMDLERLILRKMALKPRWSFSDLYFVVFRTKRESVWQKSFFEALASLKRQGKIEMVISADEVRIWLPVSSANPDSVIAFLKDD